MSHYELGDAHALDLQHERLKPKAVTRLDDSRIYIALRFFVAIVNKGL